MTYSFRKKFFWAFVALFVLVGAILIFYIQGYRVDFSSFSVKKTGAVYIESTPNDIEIFLNQKSYKDKSSILQKGTLITNILPKKYYLSLKKDGYFDYEKNITVDQSAVVRLLNIVFVPKEVPSKNIDADFKGTKIIQISQNQDVITQDQSKNIFYLYRKSDLSKPVNLTSTISTFFKQKLQEISFYPQEENKFIITTPRGLYIVDIDKKTSSLLQAGTIYFNIVDKNNLYSVVETSIKTTALINKKSVTKTIATSTLEIIDLSLAQKAGTITTPFDATDIVNFGNSSSRYFYLLKNGSLYIQDKSSNQFTLIAQKAASASFSPNENKILFQDQDGKAFVFLFEDDVVNFDMKKGEQLKLNIPDTTKIKNISWYKDSYHIVFQYPQKLYFAEITKTEPNNNFKISDKMITPYYDKKTSSYYYLEEGKITYIEL